MEDRRKERKPETLIATENKQEAEEVMQFLDDLDTDQKAKFLEFIRGAKFVLGLTGKRRTA